MAKQVDALRAEVEALRAEVALLRSQQAAHVCPSWPQPAGGGVWPTPSPQCSCGTSLRCMKHNPADWGNVWISTQNACAGAAPVLQTYIMNTTCANPSMIQAFANTGCAAGVPSVLTLNIPAGV